MLTSITPLGERGRGSRWGVTVTFLIAGALLAGAGSGAIAGALGGVVWSGSSEPARLAALVVALLAGLAIELGLADLTLPTIRRQVNENWLGAYRGWVYGLGFGLQLGVGVATIVTTSAVYLALLAELLAGSAVGGALIGGAFGLVRGLTVLPAGSVRTPDGLRELARGVRQFERPLARFTCAGMAAAAAAGTLLVVLGA
jgi:hypothetical protein